MDKRLFNRFTHQFYDYVNFYLLMVTIAGYAVEKFDASTSTAGLVSSIFIIGTLFGRLGTGRIIGDWGSKKHYFVDYYYLCYLRCLILSP